MSAELARRLRANETFQVVAYRSWAASVISDPETLDVVLALIEAYERSRQEIRPNKGKPTADEVDARNELLIARGEIRRLHRTIDRLSRRTPRLPEDRHEELLEVLGLTSQEYEAIRARLPGLSPMQALRIICGQR